VIYEKYIASDLLQLDLSLALVVPKSEVELSLILWLEGGYQQSVRVVGRRCETALQLLLIAFEE